MKGWKGMEGDEGMEVDEGMEGDGRGWKGMKVR